MHKDSKHQSELSTTFITEQTVIPDEKAVDNRTSSFLSVPQLKHNPTGINGRTGGRNDKGIKLATCNIEGVRSNTPFLQTLCEQNDIICLQEHWL